MVDRGPVLTSAIIFYLSIGAAIFQVLEEPNWKTASENFRLSKERILSKYQCLNREVLEDIVEVVSEAAGQGVTLSGNYTFNNWNWPNAVVFCASIITTIGYGNISPKTPAGRLFCVFFGLFGVPLCLTWLSALGKFFGGKAKKLGQFMRKRGVGLRKAQFFCTAIFIIWGVLFHLVLPPFVFMATEGWSYIEGLYFSFITISTVGFGDYVAGVNTNIHYSVLYRWSVEMWIYMGLAWLSLFINWKVSMFLEVHKALKKRRKRRKESFENDSHSKSSKALSPAAPKDVKVFDFIHKKSETYNDLMKQIGKKGIKPNGEPIVHDDKVPNGQTSVNLNPNKNSKNFHATYTRVNGTDYEKVSFSHGHRKENGMEHLSNAKGLVLMGNQLDRISEEEGEKWDSRESQPLIIEHSNISFVNELEEEDLSADEGKSKSSIEDNTAVLETPPNEDTVSCTDESSCTSSELEISIPYEQLMNTYKADHAVVDT